MSFDQVSENQNVIVFLKNLDSEVWRRKQDFGKTSYLQIVCQKSAKLRLGCGGMAWVEMGDLG